MREVCIDSVKAQTCDDYTQLLLQDDKTEDGYGVGEANKALHSASPLDGQYIMVLDDDDLIAYDDFVADFKEFIRKDKPDIVMFRGRVGALGLVPSDKLWQRPPRRGRIGSFCFAVKRKLWKKYITAWGGSDGFRLMGDYTFINKCYNNATTIYWMDRLVAITQRISKGRGESKDKQVQKGIG